MKEAKTKSNESRLLSGPRSRFDSEDAVDPRSSHGYGIAQHIQMLSANVLTIEEGSLYPALQRMLVKAWCRPSGRLQRTTGKRASTGSRLPGRSSLASRNRDSPRCSARSCA
jgi:hypothetical protein